MNYLIRIVRIGGGLVREYEVEATDIAEAASTVVLERGETFSIQPILENDDGQGNQGIFPSA